MLNTHFDLLLERITGYTWVSRASEPTSAPSERTLRNWLSGTTTPTLTQIQSLREANEIALSENLLGHGMPNHLAKSLAKELSAEPGLMSTTVRELSIDANAYYRTLEFSRRVDQFSNELLKYRQENNLDAAKRATLGCQWLTADHWRLTYREADSLDEMRLLMAQAHNWDALNIPLSVIKINIALQFLATLDLEFCSRYFSEYDCAALFLQLHPKLSWSETEEEGGMLNTKRQRDLVHKPIRRLIDFMGCLRYRKINRRWPDKVPSVKDIASWMDVDDTKLRKLRLGQRFLWRDFDEAWKKMFRNLEVENQPPVPWPLFIAAHLLNILYIRGNSAEGKAMTIIIPGRTDYLKWWNRQKAQFSQEEKGLRFGTAPWYVPFK